jgi:hypothetical protein
VVLGDVPALAVEQADAAARRVAQAATIATAAWPM